MSPFVVNFSTTFYVSTLRLWDNFTLDPPPERVPRVAPPMWRYRDTRHGWRHGRSALVCGTPAGHQTRCLWAASYPPNWGAQQKDAAVLSRVVAVGDTDSHSHFLLALVSSAVKGTGYNVGYKMLCVISQVVFCVCACA